MEKREELKMNKQYIVDNSITYKTDFICTYQNIDDFYETTILYQIQFLQAFDLLEFNDNIINKITESLYEIYKENKYILKIIKSYTNYQDDYLSIFRLCFRYDTFYLMHSILSSLINNKQIKDEHYRELLGKSL